MNDLIRTLTGETLDRSIERMRQVGSEKITPLSDQLRYEKIIMRRILDAFPHHAVFVFRVPEFTYTHCMGPALTDAGYEPANMIGRRPHDILTPAQLERVLPFYEAAAAGQMKEGDIVGDNGETYRVRSGPIQTNGVLQFGKLRVIAVEKMLSYLLHDLPADRLQAMIKRIAGDPSWSHPTTPQGGAM